MSRRLIFVAVAAGLVAATSAASRPEAGSAACSVRSVAEVTAPRDCSIRGTVSGRVIDPDGGTTTWAGNLVLRQQLHEAGTFLVAAGSNVKWEHSSSAGGCQTAGGGDLDWKHLAGGLYLGSPIRLGLWRVDLDVRAAASMAGEPVMPVTIACPGGSEIGDISVYRGRFPIATTHAEPQPLRNLQAATPKDLRTGTKFFGTFTSDPESSFTETWTWNLSGRVFADEISKHGVDFIKKAERLWQPCTASGARWTSFKKAAPPQYSYICAYPDDLEFCTIGYGHLLHGRQKCTAADNRLRWTEEKAEETFRDDIQKRFEPDVRAFSRKYGLNQCQFDALMSFIFNLGTKVFNKSLTAGLSPHGWVLEIPQRLGKYRTGQNPNYKKKDPETGRLIDPYAPKKIVLPGLVKRRFTEAKWFLKLPCPCQGVAAPK